jgi:hypothetical protein
MAAKKKKETANAWRPEPTLKRRGRHAKKTKRRERFEGKSKISFG